MIQPEHGSAIAPARAARYTPPVLPGWLIVPVMAAAPVMPSISTATDLVAAASSSGRPRECVQSSRRALGPTVWEKARVPNLQRFCDLVARAQAQVSTAPLAAIESAALADKALPGRAGPAVILARAYLSLGKIDEAAREFARARAIDPRSVEDPPTMYDLARVLRRTGKIEQALSVYRALVPRIDLLPQAHRRVSVLLEAAHVSMAAEALPHGDAPIDPRLDEAIAYLREARQRPPTQLTSDVLLSLALVLDRAGDSVQADAVLGDAHRMGAKLRPGASSRTTTSREAPATLDYLAVSSDQRALQALASEATDRNEAAKHWEAFLSLQNPGSPWIAPARLRLEHLRKSARPGARLKTPSRRP